MEIIDLLRLYVKELSIITMIAKSNTTMMNPITIASTLILIINLKSTVKEKCISEVRDRINGDCSRIRDGEIPKTRTGTGMPEIADLEALRANKKINIEIANRNAI